jgi:O-antigen/teichoic acid export membrane protein
MIDDELLNQSSKVFKNSLWLTLQPLFLNIISIAVIGYIARVLGEGDYGKFIFAFAFVSLFLPFINMGLSSLTTREIAEDRGKAGILIEKLISLRLFLALVSGIVIFCMMNLMGYPHDTKVIVFLATLTLVAYSVSITMNSIFQGFEKMKYIAYYQFISGLVLTVFSVLVLFAGYRLTGLTLVYMLGSFMGTAIAVFYAARMIKVTRVIIDLHFWSENIIKGFPFLMPGLLMLIGIKIGIIMLSKYHGDVSVGAYGAANTLIEKLTAIPDGLSTAIFPALAAVNRVSRTEAAALFEKFFQYSFLLALPIAVGTTLIAKPIMMSIFGAQYVNSIPVLQILIWWFLFISLNSIQGWALAAIHLERKVAFVAFVTMVFYIAFNALLIPSFKEVGAAMASVIASAISFLIYSTRVKRHFLPNFLRDEFYFKVIAANIIMGAVTYFLKDLPIVIPLISAVVVYTASILSLNAARLGDVAQFCKTFYKKEAMPGVEFE